jgi:hypothetical protein
MPSPRRFRKALARTAFSAAMALFLAWLGGCVLDPASGSGTAADPSSGSNALRDQSPAQPQAPGVPRGCTRVYSAAAMDSVLNCPDIRPPKPK